MMMGTHTFFQVHTRSSFHFQVRLSTKIKVTALALIQALYMCHARAEQQRKHLNCSVSSVILECKADQR